MNIQLDNGLNVNVTITTKLAWDDWSDEEYVKVSGYIKTEHFGRKPYSGVVTTEDGLSNETYREIIAAILDNFKERHLYTTKSPAFGVTSVGESDLMYDFRKRVAPAIKAAITEKAYKKLGIS